MAKREQEEPFFQRLAGYMATNDKDIWVASTELELGLTSLECDRVAKNKNFQKYLRSERNKIYNDLATDPQRTKETLIGKAVYAIDKLLDAGAFDKALTGILSLAKIEGIVGSETNVNVFANLSTKEMAELKTRLKAGQQDGPPSAQA